MLRVAKDSVHKDHCSASFSKHRETEQYSLYGLHMHKKLHIDSRVWDQGNVISKLCYTN